MTKFLFLVITYRTKIHDVSFSSSITRRKYLYASDQIGILNKFQYNVNKQNIIIDRKIQYKLNYEKVNPACFGWCSLRRSLFVFD